MKLALGAVPFLEDRFQYKEKIARFQFGNIKQKKKMCGSSTIGWCSKIGNWKSCVYDFPEQNADQLKGLIKLLIGNRRIFIKHDLQI